MTLTIEAMARFCKEKGFVYQSGELYGGLAGFWDFGHLGVALKNNVKNAWWKSFVLHREDVVGVDGSIITHKKVWEASGHVSCFADLLLTCKGCKQKYRADQFLEEKLNKSFDGIKAAEANALIHKHKLICSCGKEFADVVDFNLMFHTQVGPYQETANTAYLRPETAQLIFADFHLVFENARGKLPLGIAQIGKAFRNEISPRDFLFRSREFEQMEIEFFTHPEKVDECPFIDEVKEVPVLFLSAKAQEDDAGAKSVRLSTLLDEKIASPWHVYWIGKSYQWYVDFGIHPEKLRIRQHLHSELAHYAGACLDIEYEFPFGWKEICGNAERRQYDLQQHSKVSGKEIAVFDEESKQKVVPYVVSEPSFGVERAFLAFLFDAYHEETRNNEQRIVLKLHPSLSPVQVGVFPLVNKLHEKSREVFASLQKQFTCFYDKSGSVGRRYARADERGVPLCVTVDFDSLQDQCVTLRDRDTTLQVRVALAELPEKISAFLAGKPLQS